MTRDAPIYSEFKCEARIINGVLQSKATSLYGPSSPKYDTSSGWVSGVSTTQMYFYIYEVECIPNWNGVTMIKVKTSKNIEVNLGSVSFNNILQIK